MSKWPFVAAVATAVAILDQATKWWIRANLPLYDTIVVIPSLFSITHVRNSGGAFSLLAGMDDAYRVPFFFVMASLAIVALIYFLRDIDVRQRLLLFAVAGVLGGAIGNLIDRATIGAVTDFLDVYWGRYHWPTFNVADSFITVGVIALLAQSIFGTDAAAES